MIAVLLILFCLKIKFPKFILFVSFSGRQHFVSINFCSCHSKADALLLLGLWPATPHNPSTAFDLRFMEKAQAFLLEGPIALSKFCASMAVYGESVTKYSFTSPVINLDLQFHFLILNNYSQHENYQWNMYVYTFRVFFHPTHGPWGLPFYSYRLH